MKLFRYRRPSLKTLLGVTKAKKRVKKELGITAALKPFRAWTNAKRRVKRRVGYADSERAAEAGRVCGGCGGGCSGGGGLGVGEIGAVASGADRLTGISLGMGMTQKWN